MAIPFLFLEPQDLSSLHFLSSFVSFSLLIPCFIYKFLAEPLKMDSPKERKPFLPRLITSLPLVSPRSSHPHKTRSEAKPKPLRPEAPSFLPERQHNENIAPVYHYPPDPAPVYIAPKIMDDPVVSKKKSTYYEDAFTARGAHNSPQERVNCDAVIVAELKTNTKVCYPPYPRVSISPADPRDEQVKDEQSKILGDLIMHLTHIYRRPESSVMVTIQEDACLILGRTALPAYLLKIYALPCFIAPITNLRNTVLLQDALYDLLRIPSSNGIVIFMPVVEENLATNGITVRGEISRLERGAQDENPGFFKTISRSMSRRRRKTSSGQSQPISPPSIEEVISPVPLPPPDTEPTQPEGQTKLENRPSRILRVRNSLQGLVSQRFLEAIDGKNEREKKEAREDGPAREASGANEAQSKEIPNPEGKITKAGEKFEDGKEATEGAEHGGGKSPYQ